LIVHEHFLFGVLQRLWSGCNSSSIKPGRSEPAAEHRQLDRLPSCEG